MNNIGIIRRVDEVGRIVIPKEVRNNLKIKNGECLEFFVENGKIILTKHNVFTNIDSVQILINIISKLLCVDVLITDTNKVLYSEGTNSNFFKEKNIEKEVYEILLNRKQFINFKDKNKIFCTYSNYLISPLIINGDVIGSIILLKEKNKIEAEEKIAVEIVNKLLINNLEV